MAAGSNTLVYYQARKAENKFVGTEVSAHTRTLCADARARTSDKCAETAQIDA